MRIHQVGGSLRDELLGLPVADRDWVVTGATPEQMVEAGFKPVGRDFPVFLHPTSHEEYALARTERKTAPGYAGFVFHASPEVTLEEDLARRDFTVNAMARVADDAAGAIIDPFGGLRDLKARVLRHVGPAFVEDPVRILRAARFVARFGFAVAPETLDLMRRMAADGEVDALVPERVWQEFARGFMEIDPVAMFAMLEAADALTRIAPELTPWREEAPGMRALRQAAMRGLALPERFACAAIGLGEERVRGLCARLRVPTDACDLAVLHERSVEALARCGSLDAGELVDFVRQADGLRQPLRLAALLRVALAAGMPEAGAQRITRALDACRGVDAGGIARAQSGPAAIQAALRAARIAAVSAALDGS
ncbi:MAG: multifunctional CCA tRNA nucleotidyl transferase/2'3'-cyclic phosphodiesterase/2'nucleotidase/phosphatase [Burkholderiales bacterium]|nr:multifunctional CCA tRNA nucleotidyl transferase/2'3'-cyclic phosphodiesterase/2'nucleotidase/phosphatase [Burkholderiales bacterium]